MKSKVSFTLDTAVVKQFKQQRVVQCASNESQFLEWILRQVLWKPKALLKLRAREKIHELNQIQDQIEFLRKSEKENEDLLQEKLEVA